MATTATVRSRVLRIPGGTSEYFISVTPAPSGGFTAQARAAAAAYAEAARELGLAPDSAIFRRIFLKGPAARLKALGAVPFSLGPGEGPVALSVVRQPPLPGGELTLLAYHAQGPRPLRKRRLAPGHLSVSAGGLRQVWSAGLNGRPGLTAAEQTKEIFSDLAGALRRAGGTLAGGCVRTWLFMGDIASAYPGMVAARSEFFKRHGLTRATHFISSTGIEGATGGAGCQVRLDAYSVPGLRPGQVSYLNDFSRLCRAADYDVTFERGTRVRYADRSHYFISGTASIDKAGGILYPGDALRQLKRTMGNIGALLRSGGAGPRDLMYLVVYLRNPSDHRRVAAYLEDNFGGLPLAVVRGAVCRPGWLVEVEGVAAAPGKTAGLPRF